MCEFFSAIYRRDGTEYHDKTNSHTNMVKVAGWPENDGDKQVYWEAEWRPPFTGASPVLAVRDGQQPTKAASRAWERRCQALAQWWQGERLSHIPADWIDVAVICGLNCKIAPASFPLVQSVLEHIDRCSCIEWLTAVELPNEPIANLRRAIGEWDAAGAAARAAAWDAARDAAWAAAVILAGDAAFQGKPNLFDAYLKCYEAGVMFDGNIIRGKGWKELGRL